jgi:hypothetical protein
VLLDLVKLLHLGSMACWLGATLWLAGDARRSLPAGPAEARAFVARAGRALGLDRWAGVLTILSGLGLVHLAKAWPPPLWLWVGFSLAVVRAGLSDALLRPSLRRLAAGLDAGRSPADLAAGARRLAAISGAGHLAWLVALAAMVGRW